MCASLNKAEDGASGNSHRNLNLHRGLNCRLLVQVIDHQHDNIVHHGAKTQLISEDCQSKSWEALISVSLRDEQPFTYSWTTQTNAISWSINQMETDYIKPRLVNCLFWFLSMTVVICPHVYICIGSNNLSLCWTFLHGMICYCQKLLTNSPKHPRRPLSLSLPQSL